MSDENSNPVLEMLRQMRGDVTAVREAQTEAVSRLSSLEGHVIAMKKDLVHTQEDVARLANGMDGLRQRLDRIERRLDMVGAT